MPRLLSILIAFLLAGAALLLGLAGTTLRTGWIDPLDWLLPGTVAVAMLILLGGRASVAARAAAWAVVALPIMLLLALAGTRLPWVGMLLLVAGLAVAAGVAGVVRGQGRAVRWLGLGALAGAAFLAPWLAGALRGDGADGATRPEVGVLSGLPLQGVALGAALGLSPVDSIGLRSPLWRGLERRFRLRPLDALGERDLHGLKTLLLAQPRGLAPEELVALDAWVRRGGRAIIFADPLLRWSDPRPLGDPARPPLTSLLDPLLTHWGLRLEPAEIGPGDPVDRRLLDSGAVVQLSGASRFSPSGPGTCALSDRGLVARCPLGAGQALIVADADWIDDRLWTLDPDWPTDRRSWTSGTLNQLSAWLSGAPIRVDPFGAWLAGEEALLRGLRLALGLLLLLVLADAWMERRPQTFPRRVGYRSGSFAEHY